MDLSGRGARGITIITMAYPKDIIQTVKDNAISLVQTHRLLRDRLFLTFLIIAVLLSLITVILLLVKVRPKDFLVPLGYSSVRSFDILGPWYRTYLFGVFSLLVTIGNFGLALKVFEKNRLASFLLIIGTVVINVFALVITMAVVSHIEL